MDRHHEWRTPVLATTGLDGLAQARTVVLRAANASTSQLVFFTDSRSPKASELHATPDAAFVFWSKRLNWQLRARVLTKLHSKGDMVESAWERIRQSPAAGDYLSPGPPGSALASCADVATAAHHLAVVVAQVESIDWLELAPEGHRRARLSASTQEWLVP